ncbi:MAG: ABC transporter permease [Ruminococcus sp.]|nr:ABC transporter permease [Ruminococcus sp.]
MSDDNNYSPVLEDIEYTDTSAKKGMPKGVEAISLDSMETNYNPSSDHRKGAPQGVEAVSLDSMDNNYNSFADRRRGDPTGVSAPVLDDISGTLGASAPVINREPEKPVITDEEIISSFNPELKAIFDNLSDLQRQQILDMRREQMGGVAPKPQVTAPVLDDDDYTPPVQEEKKNIPPPEPVEKPVLDEEPELPKYTPKYVDADLERIKSEAKKQAVTSQLTSNQKDSKESLRMMLELKEQRNAELAEKGFRITIVIAIIGVIGAIAFYLLYSGSLGLTYKDAVSGMGSMIKDSSLYIAIISAIGSITLITGMNGLKSIASFVFIVVGILQVFPGLAMIPQHNGSLALAGILYGVSIGCTVAVIVMLSASEAVGLYFKQKK